MKTTITLSNPQRIPVAILPAHASYQPQENRSSLWEVGPDEYIVQQLIGQINQARQMICVQSFIMDDNPIVDALVQAAERGVAVFVTGATVKLNPPEEEPEFRTQSYIKLLESKFNGRLLFRAADHFHAKFVLIDPKTDPKGTLLTANLTSKALTCNPELAVPLNQTQVKELYQQFRYHFWEEAEAEHSDRKEFDGVKAIGKFALPTPKQVLFTQKSAEDQVLRGRLLETIQAAEAHICLSTYNLDPTHPVAKALLAKAETGVSVQLFFPERAHKIKEACLPFLAAGAEVFIQPYLHAKALLVDGKQGYVFSANVETYGLDQGWETGLVLNQKQSKDLGTLFADWATGFGRLQQDLAVTAHTGPIQVLNGELKPYAILPQQQKKATNAVRTFAEVKMSLQKLQAERYAHQTVFDLNFSFSNPPAKFEKKRELMPGLWEIERPGKKGKAPRQAWLIEGQVAWQAIQPQLNADQLTWNVYEK